MVRTKQSSRDGHARFPPRHKGHFWFENRVGKRQALNGKRDRDDDEIRGDEGVIVLPNRYAIRAFGTPPRPKEVGIPDVDEDESFSSAVSGKKELLDLPNEVMTLIFEDLISTEGAFHFFPIQSPAASTSSSENQELWSIHHIRPTTLSSTPSMLLSLALLSKRIRDLVYDLFYGQNQFVVQLSPTAIKKSIVEVDNSLVKREGFGDPCGTFRNIGLKEGIESWCRVNDRMPLEGNVWRFVRNLKIQIVVGNGEEEMSGIKGRIEEIARCFEMVEELKLRTLEVGFVVSEDEDVVTRSLRVVKRDDDDGLSMEFLEGQENGEPFRGMAGIEELLEPLWKIKALQDVLVVNAPEKLADDERAAKRRKVV